jgi:hypothetical protein
MFAWVGKRFDLVGKRFDFFFFRIFFEKNLQNCRKALQFTKIVFKIDLGRFLFTYLIFF